MYAKDDQFMASDSIKGCPIQFRLYDAIIGSLRYQPPLKLPFFHI